MNWARSRIGLFGIFIVTALLGQVVITSSVHALDFPDFTWTDEYADGGKLSEKQIRWCVANMNDETDTSLGPYAGTTTGSIIADCKNPDKNGPCTSEVVDLDWEYSCIYSVAEDNPLYQEIKKAEANEVTLLQELTCGKASNPQQADRLMPCFTKVRDIYFSDKCYFRNGTSNKDGRTTAKYAAECVYPTIRGIKSSLTLSAVQDAIRKGRKESNAAVKAAVKEDMSRQECISNGGEWKDKTCIENTNEDTTTCAIDGVGWIICPIMGFMAGIVDAAYGQIASWLTVTPISTTTTGGDGEGTMYSAWSTMRNIANIAFVIGFMVIIYSQLTSVGLSNYGIKKMLPKIMVAAILVNVSYWVCAVAVDISNIAGASLYSLFDTDVYTQGIKTEEFGSDISSTGNGWTGIVAGILATAGLYLALPALIVALPAALLAIVTVFLVLALRQVLIILLIVISPLAFVALLLPNTEDWFKKWRKLFQTLLLMYPIIAVIFGASAMASTIVMNSAKDIEGDGKLPIQIMGALMTILPLAITPIVMKLGGGLLGRFGGMINNPNRGPFDKMRKRTDAFAGRIRNRRTGSGLENAGNILKREGGRLGDANSRRRRVAAALRSGGRTLTVNADEKDKYAEIGANGAKRNYIAGRASGDDAYAKALAGGDAKTAQIVQDYAVQAIAEERTKDIKAATARIANLNNLEIADIARTGMHEGKQASAEVFAAATHRIMETGSFDERRDSLEFLAKNKQSELGKALGNDETLRGEAAQRSIARGDSNIYGAGFGNQLIAKNGEIDSADTLKQAAVTNAASGSLSAEHVVQNNMSTKYLVESITTSGDANAISKLQQAAETARTQTSTASKVTGKIDEQFKKIGVAPAPSGAQSSTIITPGDPGFSRTGGGPVR